MPARRTSKSRSAPGMHTNARALVLVAEAASILAYRRRRTAYRIAASRQGLSQEAADRKALAKSLTPKQMYKLIATAGK